MPFSTYDRLFRRFFGDPESAADLARNTLPQKLLRKIDLDSAEVIEGSFVDEKLRGHQTDLLVRFHSSGGREIYVYVLVEHKSRPDCWAGLQMLRYVVRVSGAVHTAVGLLCLCTVPKIGDGILASTVLS